MYRSSLFWSKVAYEEGITWVASSSTVEGRGCGEGGGSSLWSFEFVDFSVSIWKETLYNEKKNAICKDIS